MIEPETLGISTIVARWLSGWRRVAPLLVGLYYAAMIPVQLVLSIDPDGRPSITLLALWGPTLALLGYAIFSEASEREAGPVAAASVYEGR